jgi:hypothetical protein
LKLRSPHKLFVPNHFSFFGLDNISITLQLLHGTLIRKRAGWLLFGSKLLYAKEMRNLAQAFIHVNQGTTS